MGSAWAQPSPTAEVAKLLEQGKLSEAAQRAQNHLKQNANDVPMRFLQGVIATEQRKYDQAIQIFTALTQDYPGLPEPYNNLAVVYAAKGEERKAAKCLSRPFAPTPATPPRMRIWATYARMASDAYAKALQLDGSGKAMQPNCR
nr:tetratricopeptide repeat protein [Comamonas jiangduensis]